jgi:hypothetical protein
MRNYCIRFPVFNVAGRPKPKLRVPNVLTNCGNDDVGLFLWITKLNFTTVLEFVVEVDVSSIDYLSVIKNDAIACSFRLDICFLSGRTLFMTVFTVYANPFGRAV